MTTRHLPASLVMLSTLSLGVAGAADPPVPVEYPLAERAPAAGPQDAAGRQARLRDANARFDQAYGKKVPPEAPKRLRFQEPGTRVNPPRPTAPSTPPSTANRMAGRFQPVNPPAGASRMAGTWQPVNPPAASAPAARPVAGRFQPVNPPAGASRMAGTWQPVNPPPAARAGASAAGAPVAQNAARSAARTGAHAAGRTGGQAAARAVAARNTGALSRGAVKGGKHALVIGGAVAAYVGISELAQSGSTAAMGAALHQTASDLATGDLEVKTSDVAGVAKDVLIGNPLSFLAYGASEIARQEEENPGQTLRDIENGNFDIDAVEVGALGAAMAASVAFGGPAGLAAYGAVKIVDQEIRDPGKTARDIKTMTGVDLEQTGRDLERVGGVILDQPGFLSLAPLELVRQEIQTPGKTSRDIKTMTGVDLEQTGKDIEKAAQDVGGFIDDLFGGSR